MDSQRQNDPQRSPHENHAFAGSLLSSSESQGVISLLAGSEDVPAIFRRRLRELEETLASHDERRRERERLGDAPTPFDCLLLGTLDRYVFDLRVLSGQLADEGHPLATLMVQAAQVAETVADRAAVELLKAHRGNT